MNVEHAKLMLQHLNGHPQRKEPEMNEIETNAAKSQDAKRQIHKIQDVLSMILAAAHAIENGLLDDDVGPAAGIAIAAEDARGLLYELIDCLGIDDGTVADKILSGGQDNRGADKDG